MLTILFAKNSLPVLFLLSTLIINSIGFGFTTQSIVSSIHYLPKVKSGMGSGIVNASHQLETC
jgi:hypothetical protein